MQAFVGTACLPWQPFLTAAHCSLHKIHLHLLHTAILFSAFFHTAKQISNDIIDAISFQEHYTKAKNEKPPPKHTALLGSD